MTFQNDQEDILHYYNYYYYIQLKSRATLQKKKKIAKIKKTNYTRKK